MSEMAFRLSAEYERRSGYRTPAIGRVYDLAGGALYHQNRLRAAERYVREAIDLYTRAGQPEGVASGYATLTRILQAKGDQAAASATMHQAYEIGQRVSPWFASFGAAWKALLKIEQGNLEAAIQWVQECGLSFDDAVSQNTYVKHIILARVLLAQARRSPPRPNSARRLEEAVHLLDRLVDLAASTGTARYLIVDLAASTGTARYLIESLVVRAVALHTLGRSDPAFADVSRALSAAQPEGFVRLFINEGPPIVPLLKRAMDEDAQAGYARRLLAELAKEQPASVPTPKQTSSADLLDPLTERELQVLRLLPTHLSSTEIARQLYVSRNTVRSHIGHIYGKLGVHSREGAVQRAQELGLL
jgi:LuxR family maltose regulon positive regulatory protein